ncbi:MAG: hypothetical protein NC307_06710 [Roseburia sp.]|nr:hypothetical protein [Roseburia sp.]
MDQIMEEYGGIFLGALAGVFVIAGALGLVFSGGILGELIILFGNTAC